MLLLAACGQEGGGGVSGDPYKIDQECIDNARVMVVATDLWGKEAQAEFTVTPAVTAGPGGSHSSTPEYLVSAGATFTMTAAPAGLVSGSATFHYDGTLSPGGLTVVSTTDRALASVGFDEDADGCPRFVAFIGFSHPRLADSGPAPSLNTAELFLNGEDMFQSLYQDLLNTTVAAHAVTWWWQSNFELNRPAQTHPFMSEDERWENTVMALLLGNPNVNKRVMVGRFTAETAQGLAYLNTDSMLRSRAYDPNDNFEVLLQGNPTAVPFLGEFVPTEHPLPYLARLLENNSMTAELDFGPEQQQQALVSALDAASWHQKAWVLDGAVAYVSGMNVKSSDWDTSEHRVFEPRRMKFKSPAEDRLAVINKEQFSDLGPRKDAGIRVAGPAAWDVDHIFQKRWELAVAAEEPFHEYASPFQLLAPAVEPADGVLTQVVSTMPEPFGERSILEGLDKAFRQATDLIYIEDQYWRVPVLLDSLKAGLAASPGLCLVVVTKDVSPFDGAKKWTLIMDNELKKAAGDRYLVLQLKVFDRGHAGGIDAPIFLPVDVHTKLTVVDNDYVSVGSANKNNRGLLYEGELNVTVIDPQFGADSRRRVLERISGDTGYSWSAASGCAALDRLRQMAQNNAAVEADLLADPDSTAQPSGMVYPLEFTPEVYMEAGPDAF